MKKEKKSYTYIGGQAVLEGVMMRGKTAMATAVRDEEGNIQIEAVRITPPERQKKFLRLPLVRGVVNLFSSLIAGTKVLMRSAEVYGYDETEEASKFEKWLAEKCKINIMDLLTTVSVLIGVLLAVGLFVFLPNFLTGLLVRFTPLTDSDGWYYLVVGVLKMGIFLLYLCMMLLMKDIRRTFMYHGAEHKTITCFESGMELTPSNAKTCKRVHNRCGTTFLFFVILVNILVFTLAGFWIPFGAIENGALKLLARLGLEVVLLPLVAGLSYELLKALAKTESPLVAPLKAPGLLLQHITTQEPTEDMLEVAIAAFRKVQEMDADPTVPECEFAVSCKLSELLETTKKKFTEQGIDESDAEWLVSIALGIKRSALTEERVIKPSECKKILDWRTQRLQGRPLWYIVGDTDFCGYPIRVDERVLIPRPETEELAMFAVAEGKKGKKSVLDLCTGSGCIAITVAKETQAAVTAVDLSEDALALARENAEANGVSVRFVESDLFEKIEEKFDVIVSNPPYIPTGEIASLDGEVQREPHMALDGGADGLDFYRRIAEEAEGYCNEGCVLLLECGENQAERIAALFGERAEMLKDFAGVSRFVKVVY